MKCFYIITCFLFLSISSYADPFGPGHAVYGLFVGIDDYSQQGADLNGCEWDARDLRNQVLSYKKWGNDNLKLLSDTHATLTEITNRLSSMPDMLFTRNIFFFAGHGTTNALSQRRGLSNPPNQGIITTNMGCISPVTLSSQMMQSYSETVAIIDACGAGIFPDNITNLSIVMSACAENEIAVSDTLNSHGVFSHYLIEGVKDNSSSFSSLDTSFEDLFDYASPLTHDFMGTFTDPVSGVTDFQMNPQMYDADIFDDISIHYTPLIESITITPSTGRVYSGDSINIEITEVNSAEGFSGEAVFIGGQIITFTDNDDGTYSASYVVDSTQIVDSPSLISPTLFSDATDSGHHSGRTTDLQVFPFPENQAWIISENTTISSDITISGDIVVSGMGTTLTIANGVTVTFADSQSGTNHGANANECEIVLQYSGELDLGANAKLTSSGNWGGVYENGGFITLGQNSIIENAQFGLFIKHNIIVDAPSSSYPTIRNCTVDGIRASDAGPLIYNVNVSNCATGISVTGTNGRPTFNHVRINGSSTLHGIESCAYAQPKIEYSALEENISSHKIFVYQYGNLDINNRSNNIYDESGNYAVYLSSNASSIYADQNHWGQYTPYSASQLFSDVTKVTSWANASDTPYAAGKAASNYVKSIKELLDESRTCERYSDLSGAYDAAMLALDQASSPSERLTALTSLARIAEKSGVGFSELRDKMSSEEANYRDYQRTLLDILECDLYVMENRFHDALNAYSELKDRYHGTSAEIDILVKMAMLYGDRLNDKAKAREYADMAQKLNPGHATLLDAYASAGIAYEPWNYENLYEDRVESFDEIHKETDNATLEKAAVEVSVSPNPANPATTLHYTLAKPGNVKLAVYNSNGQKVATLVDNYMSAGKHSAVFDGSDLASGVYFYRLESKDFAKSGKMLLIK